MLGPLILTGHDNARGQMCDANGRGSLVDMLSASSAGTVGIDPQIALIYLDIDILFDVRHDIAGCKGSLTLTRRIVRGDPHQAVDTFLSLQIAVGILPVNLDCDGLDPGFFPVQKIKNRN